MTSTLSEVEWARVRIFMAERRRSDCNPDSMFFRHELAKVAKRRTNVHAVAHEIAREALKYARED